MRTPSLAILIYDEASKQEGALLFVPNSNRPRIPPSTCKKPKKAMSSSMHIFHPVPGLLRTIANPPSSTDFVPPVPRYKTPISLLDKIQHFQDDGYSTLEAAAFLILSSSAVSSRPAPVAFQPTDQRPSTEVSTAYQSVSNVPSILIMAVLP